MIDQGHFTLETKVSSLLDETIYFYDSQVEIKHLLSHTSGIPDYLDESMDEEVYIDNGSLRTTKDYLNYFPKREQEFQPGSKFKYHNGAFVLLALVIEQVSQMSYQTYINDVLCKPLGIENSGIYPTSIRHPHFAMGYVNLEQGKNYLGYIPEMAGGDGGATFSAHDFFLITEAFKAGKIISKSLVEAFVTPQIEASLEQNEAYGLGLWLKRTPKEIIPFVVGVDAGVQMKAAFSMNETKFTWIASNTNDDLSSVMGHFDQLAFGVNRV